MTYERIRGTGPWTYYFPDLGETRADAREAKPSEDETDAMDIAKAIAAKEHSEEPFDEIAVAVIDAEGHESIWDIDAEPDVHFSACRRP